MTTLNVGDRVTFDWHGEQLTATVTDTSYVDDIDGPDHPYVLVEPDDRSTIALCPTHPVEVVR